MKSIKSYHKDKTYHNRAYLLYIKSLPCAKCDREKNRNLDIVCHHEKLGGISGGISIKPHDTFTVPLCIPCHHNRNLIGRNTFWNIKKPKKDLKLLIIKYLSNYIRLIET